MSEFFSTINIFRIIHSTLSSLCALVNLLLIYVAVFKSPKSMRVYAVLVVNLAMTDFSVSVLNFYMQQRIIPAGMSIAFISTGPCSAMGEKACYTAYSVLIHFYTHALWLLLISFGFRYFVLLRPEPKRLHLQLVIFMFYIPSFIQMILFHRTCSDITEVRKMVVEKFPDYNITGLTVTGILDITQIGVMYTIFHIVFASTPIFVTILILRRKIIQKLEFKGINLRSNTKNLHAQLLKVLTFQAIIPVFYLLGCLAYAIGQIGIFQHPILEYFVFTSYIIVPILSPVISLVFITPYRRFIVKLFRKSVRMSVDPSVSSTNGSKNMNSVAMTASQ